jgi:hypothetical protein
MRAHLAEVLETLRWAIESHRAVPRWSADAAPGARDRASSALGLDPRETADHRIKAELELARARDLDDLVED